MYRIVFLILLFIFSFVQAQSTYIVSKDGSGNFSSISQVNSANLNSGDIVSFRAGEIFDDAILDCKSGVTYNTDGTPQAIIGNPSNTSNSYWVYINEKHNVTIENLKIFGTSKSGNYQAGAIRIESNLLAQSKIISTTDYNISIIGCNIRGGENSTISHSKGIQSNGGIKGLKILNNEISFFGKGIYVDNPYNVIIDGNHIHDIFFADPLNGIFTNQLHTRGGVGVELYGAEWIGGKQYAWDVNYSVVVSNNNIYDYETSCISPTTISSLIIEYNEVHDNLDERIFHGGIDHAHGLGKIDDHSYGGISFPGSYGDIVRYNKIYNINRWNKSPKYEAHDGFEFTDRSGNKFESDGSVYIYKDYNSTNNAPYSPYSLGALIDGSGYGAKIYGNLIYDSDFVGIVRAAAVGNGYQGGNYTNEIYNNTFWNVSYNPNFDNTYLGAAIIKAVNETSPIYIRNNIFYFSNSFGSAIYVQAVNLFEGNNIFIEHSKVKTDGTGDGNFISPPVAIYVAGAHGGIYNQIGNKSVFGYDIKKINELFIDVENKDFRLKPGSIAIDAGAEIGNSADGQKYSGKDYLTGRVDIGAFEFSASSNNDPIPEDDPTPEDNSDPEEETSTTPVIVNQPTDQIVFEGDVAHIKVTASCSDPIKYQWWKEPFVSVAESKILNNSKYSGATSSELIISSISNEDGTTKYICEVYNEKDHENLWINTKGAELTITSKEELTNEKSELNVILEGAVVNGKMSTLLNEKNLLPKSQPYNNKWFNYSKFQNVKAFHNSIVDWVLIELRTELQTTEKRFVALLDNEGSIVNLDASKDFSNLNIPDGNYFIVIHHRNHLPIMSSSKIIVNNSVINYDFTTGSNKAYGTNSMAKLTNGKFAMFAGDGDANKTINKIDFGLVANNIFTIGYEFGDLDMNGIINVLDYSKINQNILIKSNVP